MTSLLTWSKVSPIKRFIEYIVFSGLVIACLLAGSPTFLSPFSVNATIEGVVLRPSLLGITTGSLPSITATQELVVPKSIPIIFPISLFLKCFYSNLFHVFNVPVPSQSLCQITDGYVIMTKRQSRLLKSLVIKDKQAWPLVAGNHRNRCDKLPRFSLYY